MTLHQLMIIDLIKPVSPARGRRASYGFGRGRSFKGEGLSPPKFFLLMVILFLIENYSAFAPFLPAQKKITTYNI